MDEYKPNNEDPQLEGNHFKRFPFHILNFREITVS